MKSITRLGFEWRTVNRFGTMHVERNTENDHKTACGIGFSPGYCEYDNGKYFCLSCARSIWGEQYPPQLRGRVSTADNPPPGGEKEK